MARRREASCVACIRPCWHVPRGHLWAEAHDADQRRVRTGHRLLPAWAVKPRTRGMKRGTAGCSIEG